MKLTIVVVAPHTGAWIETLKLLMGDDEEEVAPHTGAWIETIKYEGYLDNMSRTPHGCVD